MLGTGQRLNVRKQKKNYSLIYMGLGALFQETGISIYLSIICQFYYFTSVLVHLAPEKEINCLCVQKQV